MTAVPQEPRGWADLLADDIADRVARRLQIPSTAPEGNAFTVRQAAEFLQLNEKTVKELIHSGRLPALRAGKSGTAYRLSRKALLDLMDERHG